MAQTTARLENYGVRQKFMEFLRLLVPCSKYYGFLVFVIAEGGKTKSYQTTERCFKEGGRHLMLTRLFKPKSVAVSFGVPLRI